MDALRGIAALLVVIFHLEFIFGMKTGFGRGYLAVDLFFSLSGYVMARSYEYKLAQGLGAVDFIKARLLRLWPIMAVGAVLGVPALYGDYPLPLLLSWCAMALVFVPVFSGRPQIFPINSPAWSILFELFANLAHALILRRLPVSWLLAIAATCGAVLLVFARSMDVGVDPATFWLAIPRVLFSYCLGITLWRVARDRRLFAFEWSVALLIGGLVLAGLVPRDQGWPDFVITMLVSPVILCGGLAAPRYAKGVLNYLGEVSFPLYAVHFPVITLGWMAGLPPLLCPVAALVAASVLRPLGKLKTIAPKALPQPA